MSPRKFHKRTITIEVLSEELIPPGMSTEEVIEEATSGEYSMCEVNEKDEILNAKQAAKALQKQGSDPSFFGLTADGNDE